MNEKEVMTDLFGIEPNWEFANIQFKDDTYCTLFRSNSEWQWCNNRKEKMALEVDCLSTVNHAIEKLLKITSHTWKDIELITDLPF